MAHEEEGGRSLADRARELYWDSARSVNSIAEDLGLSKGALYELIRPLPVGRLCPECGSELVFATRTARDRDQATCPFCGAGGEEDGAPLLPGTPTLSRGQHPDRPLQPQQPASRSDGSPGASRTLGGVLIAVAAVLLLVRYLRR